jgi:AcrR family transcriptional regulator
VNADAAATKQRILDSALDLFGQRGIDGVSLRELAANAQVSSAMIHHCFGGKDGLRQAAIDTMYNKLQTLSVEMMMMLGAGETPNAGEVFDKAVAAAYQFVRAHRSAVRWLLRDVVGRGSLDSQRVASTYAPFMNAVTARLSSLTGVEASMLRMPLHSSITLVARYGVSDDSEMLRLTGADDPEVAATLVQEELRQTVRQLMRLPAN